MRIKNKKTGELIEVPPHLESDVKSIIAKGGDPMAILNMDVPQAKNGRRVKSLKKMQGDSGANIVLGDSLNMFDTNGLLNFDYSQGTTPVSSYQNSQNILPYLNQTNTDNFDYNTWLNSGIQLPNKPPQTLSINPYINRINQGVQAIAKGNEQDNDALMVAGTVKTAFGAGAGLTNLASNIKQNYFTNKQENNRTFSQLDGALFNPYLNKNQNKGTNNNPVMIAKHGKYLKNFENAPKHLHNVEYEGGEGVMIPTQNGDIVSDYINSSIKHENFNPNSASRKGITSALPPESYVFTDHLKPKDYYGYNKKGELGLLSNKNKKTLSKIVKPYLETSMEENPYKDKYSDSSTEVAKLLSNPLLSINAQKNEEDKINGVFGKKVQKDTLNDYKMKYGGMKKMDGTSGSNMTPFESTTESRKKPSWWSDRAKLEEMMSNFEKTSGHSFPYYTPDYDVNKMAADYQKAVIAKYPQIVTNLFKNKALPFTNKAVELYKKQNKTKTTPNETELIKFYNKNPQLITEQFGDDLWGMRGFEMQDLPFNSPEEYAAWKQDKEWIPVGNNYFYDISGENETPIVFKPKLNYSLGEKTVKPSTPYEGLDLQDTGATTIPTSKRDMSTLISPIGRTYGRLPIQKLQLTPEEFVPELINPQAQINEITRGTYKGNSTVDRSNKAQDFTNQYTNIQQILGSTANQNALIKNQAKQYNLQNRYNTNVLNNQYNQTFWDNQATREAAINSQKILDQNAYTKALADLQHQENTLAYLGDIYNPAFANARLNTTVTSKKYGGKIKIKKKTKK